MTIDRRLFLAGAAGFATAGLASRAIAQAAWPNRPVRVIVPFPAGGTTDVVARILAERLQAGLGQPFVVENRGGSGGAIGADIVARAEPDGHVVMMHNLTFPFTTMVMEVAGRRMHRFEDFAPVSLAVNVPMMLMAHPSVRASNLKEYVELLKSDRSLNYNYGSTGPGSTMHLLGEMVKKTGGIEMQHIPFRGAAPLVQDLLAGRVQFGGDQLSSSLSHLRGGTLKALATVGDKRPAALPDVPTVRELGFAGMEVNGWNGIFAPAKTPPEIIARLQGAIAAAMATEAVRTRLTGMGAEATGSAPAELQAAVDTQIRNFRPIIEELRINPEG
ncbi:MAG: tripartite tricarboxylate transporter substrate binding protein [Phreatobacter sp.]|uniref:Bug family tripartite tricarboxylate transporter substrate binding protein n=1 Tax=Phreatobacter sp. TaxID=1966341 RepID=UPI001A48FD32|nr:tripartite tricarboxylate transporter substrate binding protein [Phreatobacter sp.]MBL8568337.1 tripartite tricarboxylate transporter substrate binding protein [Phreatobacter sp.]